MTLEQILNCSADQLEAMSDEQLKQYFAPFFNVTRPELASIEKSKKTILSPAEREKQRKIERGKMLVEQFMKKQEGLKL